MPQRRPTPLAERLTASRSVVARAPLPRDGEHLPGDPFDSPEESTLEVIWRIARSRWWLIAQAVVVVLIAVAVLTATRPTTYEATASLTLSDSAEIADGTLGQTTDPAREAATSERLISLPVISERASRVLNGQVSPTDIRGSVDVDTSLDSDLIDVRASSGDARQAAAVANAYARAYAQFRRESIQARIAAAITGLESRVAQLPPDQQEAEQGRDLRSRIETLRVQASLDDGGVQIVQQAGVPSDPAGPSLVRNLAMGLLLGLAIGFALAALAEQSDHRIKKPEQVERLGWLPVLGRIPKTDGVRNPLAQFGSGNGGPTAAGEHSREALLTLRTNVHNLLGKPAGTLILSSALPGDGKTTVATQLATVMALIGDDVVLVDADMHKPNASLVEARTPGLSSVLQGAPLEDVLVRVPVQDGEDSAELAVLPSGPALARPLRLLESDAMRELIAALESRFGTVIIDTPAIAAVSDALAIMPAANGVLVVVGLGNTTRRSLVELRDQLQLVGVSALGCVLNYAPVEASTYSYYGR